MAEIKILFKKYINLKKSQYTFQCLNFTVLSDNSLNLKYFIRYSKNGKSSSSLDRK